MGCTRGDIVSVFFKLPGATSEKSHPAVIISNDDTFTQDECYICVMITEDDDTDYYSFPISDKMLSKPLAKPSQARLHLIAHVMHKHLTGTTIYSKMKPDDVDKLCAAIQDKVFCT